MYTYFCRFVQMVYNSYTKLRIIHHYTHGYKPYALTKLLAENEGIKFGRCMLIVEASSEGLDLVDSQR